MRPRSSTRSLWLVHRRKLIPHYSIHVKIIVANHRTGSNPVVPQEIIIGRAIKPAEERFDLLKQWTQECNERHTLCRVTESKLPTRVIDVGETDIREPSIKVTNEESGQYIALSHCWGSNPLIRTTKETLTKHQRQLPMDKLPKTFQDAVTISRMLNVRYLWIDSLCIVQDDVQDWEEQSAVMGDIYSQSYLTIAAAASKDSSGGCFLPRSTDTHVRVKCSINDSETGYVFIREKPNGFDELDESILNTRAWVAQERLLSPRTIHYDVDQILWECREARHREDTVPVDAFHTQRLLWDGRLHLQYPYTRKGTSDGNFVWDWYDFIENYTTRNLTNADDKLPAISGLASVMKSRIGDKYIAGLWHSHFTIGLLWHRKKEWLTQPVRYRAPSWSWAAYDGYIVMPAEADIESSMIPALPMAEVTDVGLKPEGRDPHGKLASGKVTLIALLRVADPRVDPQSELYRNYEEQSTKEHLYDQGESIGWAIFDEAYSQTGSIYCLQITIKRLPVQELCYSLLLKSTGRENEFRRIGFGCPTRTGWYNSESKSLISIV
jgi:hypothetical protein